MYSVKIYGAGSIGNHLAHACRRKGWNVLICDVDAQALHRTKNDIYPSRYGAWDDGIRLCLLDDEPKESYDIVIIGTPPDCHVELVDKVLSSEPPRIMLIEKPLCPPDLVLCQKLWAWSKKTDCFMTVGYNHTLTQHTRIADQWCQTGILGDVMTITAGFLEHWGGIFQAHPWLAGPQDSYLGFRERGGGASGEHSHAINIWQHFAHVLGQGRIVEVTATMDLVNDGQVSYDRMCQMHVRTESGLLGHICQDVITKPSQKFVRIQGSEGYVEWEAHRDASHDFVGFQGKDCEWKEHWIEKQRPDDFLAEVDHIKHILENTINHSPISLERGLETMLVIAAAYLSHTTKSMVRINYDAHFSLQTLVMDERGCYVENI